MAFVQGLLEHVAAVRGVDPFVAQELEDRMLTLDLDKEYFVGAQGEKEFTYYQKRGFTLKDAIEERRRIDLKQFQHSIRLQMSQYNIRESDRDVGFLFHLDEPYRWIKIIYKGRELIFWIVLKNVYLKGFRARDGVWHELCKEGDSITIAGPGIQNVERLGFRGGYPDLNYVCNDKLGKVPIGRESLIQAFEVLCAVADGKDKSPKVKKKAILVFILMIPELARQKPISDFALDVFPNDMPFGYDNAKLARSWSTNVKAYNRAKLRDEDVDTDAPDGRIYLALATVTT